MKETPLIGTLYEKYEERPMAFVVTKEKYRGGGINFKHPIPDFIAAPSPLPLAAPVTIAILSPNLPISLSIPFLL